MAGKKRNTALTEQEEIAAMKDKAVEYYRRLPLKGLAAAKVGRDYDTLLRWEKEDTGFAVRLKEAKADFAVKQIENRKMTPQFALERIFKQEFGATLDVTSAGEKLEGLTILPSGSTS